MTRDMLRQVSIVACLAGLATAAVFFVATFNGTPTETSRDALHARYAKAFAQFPQNKAELKNRIAVGNTVVDHELVIRAPGGEQFEIIAIYTFKDGLISHVDFAK